MNFECVAVDDGCLPGDCSSVGRACEYKRDGGKKQAYHHWTISIGRADAARQLALKDLTESQQHELGQHRCALFFNQRVARHGEMATTLAAFEFTKRCVELMSP